jgi:hypothetical protein
MMRMTGLKAGALAVALVAVAGLYSPAEATSGPQGLPSGEPTVGAEPPVQGAVPLRTDETIPYWHGQFTDPTNGTTYGYNMVGADPATHGDVTVPVDIVPLNFTFDSANGYSLNGANVVNKVLASPIFQPTDFTTAGTVTSAADANSNVTVVPGGPLSAGNTGAQFADAYMRAQFNAVGTGYHLRLSVAKVWPAVTIAVPKTLGGVFVNSRGVVWGESVTPKVLSIQGQLHLDPRHLWIFITDNVYVGDPSLGCCTLGFHTAGRSTTDHGPYAGQGDQQIPTWIYAAYMRPGTFNPHHYPLLQDIEVLTHEVAEWADDPFVNNSAAPWGTAESPAYGCTNYLEVGDPVTPVDFTVPGNPFESGPYGDGSWHLQDEMFLPWFSRQSPNTTSQLTQMPSARGGRYSFLGDLNPYDDFHQPAGSC